MYQAGRVRVGLNRRDPEKVQGRGISLGPKSKHKVETHIEVSIATTIIEIWGMFGFNLFTPPKKNVKFRRS
jgi:hypothetical protein